MSAVRSYIGLRGIIEHQRYTIEYIVANGVKAYAWVIFFIEVIIPTNSFHIIIEGFE